MKSKGKVPLLSVFIRNDDTLMEILLRLPAKYLIRFKLVCKQWLSLISSDNFSRLHTLRHPQLQPSLILKIQDSFYFNPFTNGEKLIIPYRFSIPNPNIINSCNGLMLLQYDPPEECVYVYNPTTRQSRKISLCSNHSNKCPHVVDLVLAFDPSKSPHYKIVCVRSTEPHYKNRHPGPAGMHIYQIEVYDSESPSHTWKQGMEMEPTSCIFDRNFGGVYFNGLIYWDTGSKIWYFDIARNDLKMFYQLDWCPRTKDEGQAIAFHPLLQVSNGHLYRCIYMSGRCESAVVWEMQGEDPSKWLLKYNDIVSQPPFNHIWSCPTPIQFRFVEGSYGSETCCLVSLKFWKVRVYNFLDKSHKEILDLQGPPFEFDGINLARYEFGESLAMV